MSIAPAALSQNSASSKTVQATPDAVVQHSICVSDPQGLMCNSNQPNVNAATATTQASRASAHTVTVLPTLSKAQMERVSDVLLGLLYFVLPIGFGIGLFMHDRRQAERAATLEAQIQLLEKLWEQSPQA